LKNVHGEGGQVGEIRLLVRAGSSSENESWARKKGPIVRIGGCSDRARKRPPSMGKKEEEVWQNEKEGSLIRICVLRFT